MFFVIISLLSISGVVKSQRSDSSVVKSYFDNQVNYYKRLNEIKDQFIMTQFINDSIKNVELNMYRKSNEQIRDSLSYVFFDKFNIIEEKRKRDIKKLKTKNFILVLSLAASIVVISFIQ